MTLHLPIATDTPRTLVIDAAAVIAIGLVLTAIAAGMLVGLAAFPGYFPLVALAIYGAIAAFAFSGLPAHGHPRFGIANIITTFRAVLTALIGATIFEADSLLLPERVWGQWALAGAAFVALALDGVDGYAARRTGRASRYGMRYDMEVDALLILFLAVLAFALGKAGIWVILIGAMRYLFIAAGAFWAPLSADLPVSFRRKTGCVYQIVALCIAILPIAVPPYSNAVALSALAFLIVSFAIDIAYLARRAR